MRGLRGRQTGARKSHKRSGPAWWQARRPFRKGDPDFSLGHYTYMQKLCRLGLHSALQQFARLRSLEHVAQIVGEIIFPPHQVRADVSVHPGAFL